MYKLVDMTSFYKYLSVLLLLQITIQARKSSRDRDLECEFPPKTEKDMRHVRTKRLTTENGLVCLEDFPYTVSIRFHMRHHCGGALISHQWVITAAQCFDYTELHELAVRAGSVYRDYGGRIYSVVDVKIHPEYKINLYYPEHNVGLAKLNMPVIKSIRTKPVKIAHDSFYMKVKKSPKGEIVVTGYGSVRTGQLRTNENQELRKMVVKEVMKSQCRDLYGNDYRLQSDHVCLKSTEGVSLCTGDTGDPAVYFDGRTENGTLYGLAVFSGTEECGYKAKPGVYTKIADSFHWINNIIIESINTDEVKSD